MASRTVLVSEATRNPGLTMMRILSQAGFEVAGADSQRLPFNLHSRYSPPYLGYQRDPESELTESLLRVVKEARPWVFQPMSTRTVQAVSKHLDRFESLTNLNVPPFDTFLSAMDKVQTTRVCDRLGIPCSKMIEAGEAEALLAATSGSAEDRSLVVKPRMDAGGAKGITYPNNVRSLHDGIDSCRRLYGEAVVHEYIPGDVEATRLILLLFDRKSRLLAYLASRKIWQWPESGGQAAIAVSSREPELLATVLPFFEDVGWQGPAEVELKIDSRDGVAKIIEINPRLPTYIGFPERCGLPLSTMLVKAAAEESQDLGFPDFQEGVRFMRTAPFLSVMLQRLWRDRRKLETLREALAELRVGARPAYWDLTDPLPRLGKLLLESSRLRSEDASRAVRLED